METARYRNDGSAAATPIRIALVGDYDPAVIAHQAIPRALDLVASSLGAPVHGEWLATDAIEDDLSLDGVDGIWCVPASPYRSMAGALRAIRVAREHGRPFLGTCAGFQHAVLEYARNVLGWADAEHAETMPDAGRAVIAPLACSLVEVSRRVRFHAGSRLARAYRAPQTEEAYHCSYGLSPRFREVVVAGPLRATAEDDAGDVRAVELEGHPFFVATLFQPERAALVGRVPPIVAAFVAAIQAIGEPDQGDRELFPAEEIP